MVFELCHLRRIFEIPMTFVRKLMIRGIRCFSPNESNTLEFYFPLTLIVGPNGTGKTTIIEALRYATTGNLPPNSRGGAFIYDPNIARETEVKAQVKLLFNDVSDSSMVCTRSLQLTQKKDRVEQKTLESVLWMESEDGRGVSVSSKCGDVDTDMPRHLGAETSVLDNIIFCHQEESTWPLSEPLVIKKKLDEIFASDKYSKALSNLKSSKKECSSDIKLKKQELEFLYKMKEKMSHLEANIKSYSLMMEKNEVRVEAYENEVKKCNDIIVEVDAKMNRMEDAERRACALSDECQRLKDLVGGFEGKKLTLDEITAVLNDESLSRVEHEYERVRKEVEEFEDRFREFDKKRHKYLEHKAELDGVFSEISVKSLRLNAAEEKRKMLLSLLESELKVKCDFRDTAMGVFRKVEEDISKRKRRICELQDEVARLKGENNCRMAALDEKMRIISEYEELEDDVSVDVSISYEDEIERLRAELDSNSELAMLEERLEGYQKRLSKAFSVAEENFVLNQMRSRKREIEEMLEGKDVSELRSRLEEQKRSLKDKKEELKKTEYEVNLRRMMHMQRKKQMESTRLVLKDKLVVLREMNKENDSDAIGEVPLASSTEQVSRTKELNDRDLSEIIDVSDMSLLEMEQLYDGEVLYHQLEEMDDILARSSGSALEIYEDMLNTGSRRHGCPVCGRMFSGPDEDRFRRNLGSILDGVPKDRSRVLERRKRVHETLKMVDDANSRRRMRNGLREDIVTLLLAYKPVDSVDECNEEILEDIELDILDITESIRKTEFHVGVVDELLSINDRLRDEEAGESVQELRSIIDGIRKVYEDKKMEVRKQHDRINKLRRNQEVIEATKEIRKKINFREEAREAVRIIRENNFKAEIEMVESEIHRRTDKLERIQDSFSRRRVSLEMNIENMHNSEREISVLRNEIEELNLVVKSLLKVDYPEDGMDEDRFNSMRDELLTKKNKMVMLGEKICSMREMRALAEENMRHHKDCERIREIEEELKSIDLEFLKILKEKKQLLEAKRTKLISQRSLLLGECKQIALGIRTLKNELHKDHSTTVAEYNKCFIENRVLEISLSDMEKCIQALDKAIVDFHSSKVEEVNSILKDLWIGTYKGNDIDWIEIKAESSGQKTYSYKVVLVKNGVELDMRGRSSAGQKMIASILIRLALAESFATGCNILALDEPTTNLDRENMESLVLTLSRVISKHKEDRNFQLIVITHDEDFVQLLSRDSLEYFYRLSRNENGDSKIVRHAVYG